MIAEILERAASAPGHLRLGARQHSILAGLRQKEIARALVASQWTCHCCGVSLPQLMEFDGGHGGTPVKAICQFCHNLDHPVWAAVRGRLEPIWAPDLDGPTLSRFSWTLLALGQIFPDSLGGDLDPGDDEREPPAISEAWREVLRPAARRASGLREMLENRRELFQARFGATATAESLLEGVMVHRGRVESGKRAALDELLAGVRFAPALVVRGYEATEPPARVSAWNGTDFEDLSGRIGAAFVAGQNRGQGQEAARA